MSEVDDLLDELMPRLMEVDTALHNGDVEPRLAMWSRNDPVTLFGAKLSGTGWADVSRTFQVVASRFSDCTAFEVEIVAAGVSGDLAYTVAFEHTTVSVQGAPRSYHLRVTQIYRRENGEWKPAHRHADELTEDEEPSNTVVAT